MILVIDNYDSFVHNIARHFEMLGTGTRVVRNDAIGIGDIETMRPDAIVVSPGPCTPAEAGISCAILETLSGRVPILGICLGHQCMGQVFGGRVGRARHPMHGLASDIEHKGERLFRGLPRPMPVARYHSLIVEPTDAMSADLAVDAWSEEGEIMALSHRRHPTYGVQFHPESVLTPAGPALFERFLSSAQAWSRRSLVSDALA